jgi:hypothetical protein
MHIERNAALQTITTLGRQLSEINGTPISSVDIDIGVIEMFIPLHKSREKGQSYRKDHISNDVDTSKSTS